MALHTVDLDGGESFLLEFVPVGEQESLQFLHRPGKVLLFVSRGDVLFEDGLATFEYFEVENMLRT